ncbi:hypothetical protein OAA54_00515 [Pelagibacteraceae bacterium]|nr:hypothetical protein [Pelagibacteraceae bacterium]
MKKYLSIILTSFFLCFGAEAKNLEQKKLELKKIYEAGGITKVEYNKSQDFIKNSEEKTKEEKLKQTFNLGKKENSKAESIFQKFKDKKKDKEEVTLKKIEELGQIIKFDNTYYTEGMTKVFSKGCNGFKCDGQNAGKFLSKVFGRSKEWGQRNPGQMIKAMAMFEVFYGSKLWYAKKSIERYKEDNYKGAKKLFYKEKDEKEIRSLIGINKGRKSMREALTMNLETPTKEAMKKFWLLGEFLDLGTGVKHKKLDKDLKERKELLEAYKNKITKLKKKLKDDLEEENEKSVE